MKELAEGAEAKIFVEGSKAIKDRVRKDYRLPEIDRFLRKFRTRREAKVFEKLEGKMPIPKMLHYSDKCMKIEMEFIKGKKLRDVLNRKNAKKLCRTVGEQIGVMHNSDVIHGDLTTSNMILSSGKIYFIDFGLSLFSAKIEDKAVDLHLLRQTLESKHHVFWKECFGSALSGYKKVCINASETIARLEQVEGRGRYKKKS